MYIGERAGLYVVSRRVREGVQTTISGVKTGLVAASFAGAVRCWGEGVVSEGSSGWSCCGLVRDSSVVKTGVIVLRSCAGDCERCIYTLCVSSLETLLPFKYLCGTR